MAAASPPGPVAPLARAQDAFGALVAGVRGDQWDAATPCTEWNVRQLVNHVVAGNVIWSGLLSHEFASLEDTVHLRVVDHLGDDPSAAFAGSAQALREAFSRPGVLAEMFAAPIGTVPGAAALHLRITELLVHGWDLARATGQPAALPDDLAEQELAFTRERLPDVRPGRSPFAPPQPVAEDAPVIDRLAALLGRPVAAA